MIFLHCRISGQHFTKSLICDIVHSGDFYTTGKKFSLPPTLTNLILGWSHSAQAHSPFRFLIRMKRSQVMLMEKFGPIALNIC